MSVKDWVTSKAVAALLRLKSRPEAIRSTLARRDYARARTAGRDRVTIAAVQMQLDLVDDGCQFAARYYDLIRAAVERGAALVAFPEYDWLPILGLLPPVRELAESGITLERAVHDLAPAGGLTIEGVFRTIAPAVQRIVETSASELARQFGVYLMPGAVVTLDRAGRLYNTSYLYGPDGALIGRQHKLHPTALEVDWMTCGDSLEVWALPFAKVAAPVCMDYTYWETTRAATLRGAEILLDMSADATADEPYLAARGDEARIQECFAFSARIYCVTQLFGLNFCGPSHIAAPLALTGGGSTYLARAETANREEVVVAELDLQRLREFRSEHPRDWNISLYEKYLPAAYGAQRTRVIQEQRRQVSAP